MADEDRTPWQGWRRKGEDAGLPAAKGAGSRRSFGATWWGRAWLEALEQRARLDPGRLSRGRSYARRGSVLELTVSPGEVEAVVQGSRVTPYQVTVRIRAFTADEWDAVLDVVSAQIGRVAALLDGELPPEVVEDVQAAGLDLLPGAGEVLTNCSCPDFAVPCKHSAAVCYLVADALDDDPFALLLLRGRRKDELLTALRSRRTGNTTAPAAPRTPAPAGIPAIAAFARHLANPPNAGDGGDGDRRVVGVVPVPAPPRPLGAPGVPAAVKVLDPPRSSGVDVRDLVALATDAARRAWELASGDVNQALTFEQDLARRAAASLGTPELADLAHHAGISARQLTTWATAWRQAGPGGLAVTVDDPHDVDPEALAEALEALPHATTEANRVTAGKIQLRLGRDNLWYRFDKSFNDWSLTHPPAPSPQDLL
ncbi:SWIM zinc finger family protein [Kribbella sp. VKM Ac-2566]|uniref:SWIM zinc finger family protein n=1 Tax=Kribbella sp. VKM Ac-2566 TaxID=2512218 RepID=UPI001063F30D|nr:SWIM zinc finger family protein [Kribbella sp. VKM Ac-2566]TDW79268.1 putative Zn finger protein [Kribbella sp. VKM Ac-2566]